MYIFLLLLPLKYTYIYINIYTYTKMYMEEKKYNILGRRSEKKKGLGYRTLSTTFTSAPALRRTCANAACPEEAAWWRAVLDCCCVCVCERERERERVCVRERVSECKSVSVRVYVSE